MASQLEGIDLNKMEAEGFKDHDDDSVSGDDQKVGSTIDLTANGGVMKKLIAAGEGWEQPQKDDKVTVHYTGTLLDGSKFDSSVDRGDPFEFTLGAGQVIKGWDVAVATMKKGEKVEVTLSSDYAYGDQGSPPKIPGGATLVFEIELLSWISLNDLSPECDGSIVKFCVEDGDPAKWDKPRAADIVTVSYAAALDGTSEPFVTCDSAEFTVQDGHFCPAVGIAVRQMKVGEKNRLKVKPQYAFGAEGREGVPPNTAIEVTMKLLKIKTVKFVDPEHSGTVVKTILEDGQKYQTPNEDAKVTLSYTACLQDGTQFDKADNVELTTCDDQFPCAGLEMAVCSMKEGEVAEVVINDSSLAFGSEGLPASNVPADAVVTYTVTVHSFVNGKEAFELDAPQKLELAQKRKAQGNAAFKKGHWSTAAALYTKAESAVSAEASFEADAKVTVAALQQSVALNQAAVALKIGKYKEAAGHANKVLDKSPGHVKALYRRCQAYTELGDFIEAENDIKSALLTEPESRDLLLAQRALKKRMKADSKRSTKLYGAMFSKVGDLYDTPPPPPPQGGTIDGAIDEVEMDAPDAEMVNSDEPPADLAGPVTDAEPMVVAP